jgi:hypothetical protein
MGLVKETVKKLTEKKSVKAKNQAKVYIAEVDLPDLEDILTQLDELAELKVKDLHTESSSERPVNQYKVATLRAAYTLILRAKALLEDYDSFSGK